MSIVNEKIRRSFRFNLLVVLILFFVAYILFFSSLKCLTHHGEEVKVPNVTGQPFETAEKILKDMGFELQIDSTYEPTIKALTVLKQVPDSNAVVKRSRIILLTINKTTPLMTPMPNLINLSLRGAIMILKNNKLILGDTTHRPDISGAVLAQKYNGNDIASGQLVPQGSRVSLVLGDQMNNPDIPVPSIVGIAFDQAKFILEGNGLGYSVVASGAITDSSSAIVVAQVPSSGNDPNVPAKMKEGEQMVITIQQNPDQIPSSNTNSQTPLNNKQK